MQINWFLVGICALIWFAGYCFGFQVGARTGANQMLDRVKDIVELLPQKGDVSNGREESN